MNREKIVLPTSLNVYENCKQEIVQEIRYYQPSLLHVIVPNDWISFY